MDETDKFIGCLESDRRILIMPEDYPKGIAVSEAILCQTSTYFVKALAGEFGEAYSGILHFPGWEADLIKIFLFWAYKGALPDFTEQIKQKEDETKMMLIRLWLFGDAHLIAKLQNTVMAQLVDLTSRLHTSGEVISFGFTRAPKDSALRKFIIDEARYEYFGTKADDGGLDEEEIGDLLSHHGFRAEFLKPLRDLLEKGDEVYNDTYPSAHEIGLAQYTVKES